MDNYHAGGMQSSGQMMGGRKVTPAGHGSQKTYKTRGAGSIGPNQGNGNNGLRPGTAQKRPASPNTQGLANSKNMMHHHNGPSPYSFGLVQQHNNLMGGGVSHGQSQGNHGMNNGQMINQKHRANSQKPSSAPSKNRIRSQSPINIEGQNS
jgi:hypothetical protein